MGMTTTAEKSKPITYSIASIIKKMNDYMLRFDHPLQRESDQWDSKTKGNLVSDILQGNPLPELVFAEEMINGIPIIWNLDGKQRCTNIHSFVNDGYKVNKNITRWNISYMAILKDENGKPILDSNGLPQYEMREFDIRNKKFSQLPEELQEKFMDYTFTGQQYINCTKEDIAYHISRYNSGKPMATQQKGFTKVGEDFAVMIRDISNMAFFHDIGGYKASEFRSGKVERVVIESVMATNHLDSWKKNCEDMCEYIRDNATVEEFENFEDTVAKLEDVITEDVADMFDTKNSFIYFGLFARALDNGINGEKFVEFMAEFAQSLHNKKINGISFDEIGVCKSSGKPYTKDTNIVKMKIDHLETLLNEFVGNELSTCA